MEKAFKITFGYKVRRKRLRTTLLVFKQGEQESTRDYRDRFAMTVQRVVYLKEAILMTLTNGLRPTRFSDDLIRDPVLTFAKAMERS